MDETAPHETEYVKNDYLARIADRGLLAACPE